MFVTPGPAAKAGYAVFLAIAVAALLAVACTLFRRIARADRTSGPGDAAPQMLVLSIALAVIPVMFLWRNVLDLSLGFARNSVFLIPLFFLSCGILIDTVQRDIRHGLLRSVVLGLACASTAVMVFETKPSPYVVQASNWAIQSLPGPLLRHLKSIDPNRNWCLELTSLSATMRQSLLYYSCRGYLIDGADNNFSVAVYHKLDGAFLGRWYRPDLFDDFQCRVVLCPNILRYYSIPQSDLAQMPVQKSQPRP
jgi:hypothetical protein